MVLALSKVFFVIYEWRVLLLITIEFATPAHLGQWWVIWRSCKVEIFIVAAFFNVVSCLNSVGVCVSLESNLLR